MSLTGAHKMPTLLFLCPRFAAGGPCPHDANKIAAEIADTVLREMAL